MSIGGGEVKVACVQLDMAFGAPTENFHKVEQKVREAAALGAKIVVLPEMWNTGYDLTRLEEIADVDGNKTKKLFSDLSKELNIHIVGGSVSTKKGDNFFNTMYVTDTAGEVVAEYNKAHLFKLMDEHHYLNEGNEKNLFSIDGVQMAGIICYDLRFPEWTRVHALDGAKVMFIPAQWPDKRIDHWKVLLQARAIENQMFVVAVNRVGKDPNNSFDGNSMVIAPWGEILWTGANEETTGIVELDLEIIEEVRNRIPIFQDRREVLYE